MAALVKPKQPLPWPALARATWFMIAGLSLGLMILLAPINFRTVTLDWQFQQSYPAVADLMTRQTYAALYISLGYAVAAICYIVAALIAWRRASEPVAWLAAMVLVMAPLMFGLGGYTETWSYYHQPWRDILRLTREVLSWAVGLPTLLAFFFYFPKGRSAARWTTPLFGLALGAVLLVSGWLLFDSADDHYDVWLFTLVAALVLGAGVQLHRYQRLSSGLERRQTKWVVAGAAALVANIAGLFVLVVLTEGSPYAAAVQLGSRLLSLSVLALFALSLAFSIFRYRLWDIDLLLNRALVYGLLTACVLGLYAALIIAAGVFLQNPGNPILAAIAIGVLALVFQPLRRRLQTAVNRMMYGERDDPATALSRLGQRLEAALAPGLELATIVETVAQALRLPYVAIEIKKGEDYISAAAAGASQPRVELIPLVYQGQAIGQLVVAPRAPGEAFSAADRRLLVGLARQAAPALHAQQLAADLQRSRERIVIAREEERRRLRRDLHDGFGPTLASQALKLDAALDLLASDPAGAARLLGEVKAQSQDTVAGIRRLVYELRPPALDELGLVGALQAHLQSLPANGLRVSVEAAPLPPLSAAVEVAAYRIALEAVTNTVRHARASQGRVRLAVKAGALELEVDDNGGGLPPNGPGGAGLGLIAMRERAAELGGACRIENAPAGGVLVSARLPLAPAEHG